MLIRICRSWNGEFKFPNLLYYRYKRYLKVPQITILMGISLLELLWPKMIISGRKIQLNQKKLKYLLIKLRILDHKSSNMQMSNQIFLWVTFKKKSRFGNWNSPFLYQKILSNIVVFLAFMVLKVKKKVSPKCWMQVACNLVKEFRKSKIFSTWPSLWPSKKILAFFNFFEIFVA